MMPFLTPFACALVVPAGVAFWGARRGWPLGVGVARVALAGYLALLLAMTLTASPFRARPTATVATASAAARAVLAGSTSHLNLMPLRSIARYAAAPWPIVRVELLGNVAAFVPFGVLVPLTWRRRPRWWQVLVAGAALSVCIEVAQFTFVPARVADVDDVLLNALGAATGLGLVWAISRASRRAIQVADAYRPRRGPDSQRSAAASRSNTCL
jgi:glycopeptide antibiotics resistance protein